MTSLHDVLLNETDAMVQRWYERWTHSSHPHPELTEAALKDLLAVQLRVIGEQLRDLGSAEDPEAMWKLTERLAPESRVSQEVPIEEVVQEYKLVVEVARALIQERDIDVSFLEFTYFYQAVFELVAESVRRYASYQADKVARERAEYLAGLTHQMRTPLSTLSLQAHLLAQTEERPDEKMLATLQRSIKRLDLLVNGVMRLERFTPAELPVRPRSLQPARIIDEVIGDAEHTAAGKGLRLEVEVNRTLEMELDQELFLDALGNLVENAVKYTSSGFVRLEVEEHPDDVVFKVSDSGPGIAPERQRELFRPVQPGKPGGVGIGLAIAHRSVTAQGGQIGLESEPGKGSLFWFRLPRVVQAREAVPAQQDE